MPGLFLLLCAQGTQAHGVAIAIIPQYDILYHLKMNTGIISDDMMRHRSSWHWTYRWASRKCPSIRALFLHVFWKGVPWPRMGLELWVTGSFVYKCRWMKQLICSQRCCPSSFLSPVWKSILWNRLWIFHQSEPELRVHCETFTLQVCTN